ncbi:MAG: tRNA-uridine aminocarboxypropyltransferase [Endozoicomonas sp.]
MPRELCTGCVRPLSQCFCKPLNSETACMDLIILQHPTEVRHPLNTARILELGINNCRTFIDEIFTESSEPHEIISNQKSYLLFPSENAATSDEVLNRETPKTLVILDGTWRKAKKILFLNPWLQQLPCIALKNQPASRYRIRKAPGKESLSTVEATVALLREASRNEEAHQPLLDAFEQMIQLQINAMGSEIYQKNYPTKH